MPLAVIGAEEAFVSRFDTGCTMRLVAGRGRDFAGPGNHPGKEIPAPASAVPESRALVVAAPVRPQRPSPIMHREAPFLAQLIATRDAHPQTRERRRAEPEAAIAAYRTAAGLVN